MNDITDDPDRISHRLRCLEAENAGLRERLRALETLTGVDYQPPGALDLYPAEARILGVLLSRDRASHQVLLLACVHPKTVRLPDRQVVAVHIHGLRKKLDLVGIEITTIQGWGYMIKPWMKSRFAEVFEPADEARA